MSTKPFINLALLDNFNKLGYISKTWAYLDQALQALEVPDCEGDQIKAFFLKNLRKSSLNKGNLSIDVDTLENEIEILGTNPLYLRNNNGILQMTTDPDTGPWLTISGGVPAQYAMKCTGTPGATAILPTVMHLETLAAHTWLDFYVRFRIDSEVIYGQHPLYQRSDVGGDVVFEMGLNGDAPIGVGAYVRLGTNLHDFPPDISGELVVGGTYTLRCLLDYAGEWMLMYLDQWHLGSLPLALFEIPVATEEIIRVGCAGYSILGLACVKNTRWLDHPRQTLWTEMPPLSYNYYNFKGDAAIQGQITDRALISTYKTPLQLQYDVTEMEIVSL